MNSTCLTIKKTQKPKPNKIHCLGTGSLSLHFLVLPRFPVGSSSAPHLYQPLSTHSCCCRSAGSNLRFALGGTVPRGRRFAAAAKRNLRLRSCQVSLRPVFQLASFRPICYKKGGGREGKDAKGNLHSSNCFCKSVSSWRSLSMF